jgi:hypothetical protein
MKVALATCLNLPEPDADETLLTSALRAAGAEVRLLAWDDPNAEATPGELVVIRSTWNYIHALERFLAWVRATAGTTRLLNPAPIVVANARKTYLRDLERRGIDVVPTEFVMQGDTRSVGDLVATRGWPRIVIKPVVSASSFQTRCFETSDRLAAQQFLEELARQRDVMIQPWMPSVETHGERSLVWIDGEITHAVRKEPRYAGGAEHASTSGVPIAADERAFAVRVLAPIASDLLYARIDMIRDDSGALRLMELELIEPSLFLTQSPHALDRLTRAIVHRAGANLA